MDNSYDRLFRVIVAQRPNLNNLKILEIGCGNAGFVAYLRKKGVDAYGADIEFKDGEELSTLIQSGYVKKIFPESVGRINFSSMHLKYRWPFDDEEFDIVVSKATIEHVQNIEEFTYENARVLKSGGISIHYFPSISALIEPHINIPFAGLYYKSDFIFKIVMCFHNRKVIESKIDYMRKYCFYRSERELIKCFSKQRLIFKQFAEQQLFKNIYFFKLDKIFWWFFRILRSKVMIFTKGAIE